MNRYGATRVTLQQIYDELMRSSRDTAVCLKAMQAQITALRQVVDDLELTPEPDANGWIARPTLR